MGSSRGRRAAGPPLGAPETMSIRRLSAPSSLDVLDERGGPFQAPEYRAAWEFLRGLRDQSFAARLEDGTAASVALTRVSALTVTSPPLGYGGVVSPRPLSASELRAFLLEARRASGARVLQLVALGREHPGSAETVGITRIVDLATHPSARFEKKGRQSIRRATRAGGEARVSADVSAFLALYADQARARGVQYPTDIIQYLAARERCRAYDVVVEGEVVSSLLVLTGSSHWMYWAAAQNERGREIEGGYLAVASMLEDAFAAGVPFVNLGSSSSRGTELPGVDSFKRRLGGVEERIVALEDVTTAGRFVRAGVARAQPLRRRE